VVKWALGFNDMNRSYYLYCRIAALVFVVNTIYPLSLKIYQQRLAGDWLHTFLHLISALFGAYAGWRATTMLPAKAFTWGIGVLYLGLGVYGWFAPGLFMDTILAIPLGIVDNLFHLLLSVPAWIIVVLELLPLNNRFSIITNLQPTFPAHRASGARGIRTWSFLDAAKQSAPQRSGCKAVCAGRHGQPDVGDPYHQLGCAGQPYHNESRRHTELL
jgi:hypothetical protein